MPINTASKGGELTTEMRKERIANLREHHQPLFDKLNIPDALFFPKMAYFPKTKNEKVISFFPSELRKGYDIYTEFVSREFEADGQERTLWKLRFNPHWETEFEATTDLQPRYLVPVSELVKVSAPVESAQTAFDFDSFVNDDTALSECTLKDIAAILLRAPVSNKPWLNKIIQDHGY